MKLIYFLSLILCVGAFFKNMPSVQAFQILTPASEPCHENITLAALDALPAPWGSGQDTDLSEVIAAFAEQIENSDVQFNRQTRKLVEELAARYNFDDGSFIEQYILTSFVLGVRFPDTRGLAIIKFNETRSTHILEENQANHMLRRSDQDGPEGNQAAIDSAKSLLFDELESAHTLVNAENSLQTETTWTFPFYGETPVDVFVPAFYLGKIAHTLQDSYSHTIRDSEFKILAVANYSDIVLQRFDEERDGPGHSERLDQCDIGDDFDLMRIDEARNQTAKMFAVGAATISNSAFDAGSFSDALDEALNYTSGCSLANEYCGSSWFQESRIDVTESISIGICGAVSSGSKNSSSAVILLLLAPFLIVCTSFFCRS